MTKKNNIGIDTHGMSLMMAKKTPKNNNNNGANGDDDNDDNRNIGKQKTTDKGPRRRFLNLVSIPFQTREISF